MSGAHPPELSTGLRPSTQQSQESRGPAARWSSLGADAPLGDVRGRAAGAAAAGAAASESDGRGARRRSRRRVCGRRGWGAAHALAHTRSTQRPGAAGRREHRGGHALRAKGSGQHRGPHRCSSPCGACAPGELQAGRRCHHRGAEQAAAAASSEQRQRLGALLEAPARVRPGERVGASNARQDEARRGGATRQERKCLLCVHRKRRRTRPT